MIYFNHFPLEVSLFELLAKFNEKFDKQNIREVYLL